MTWNVVLAQPPGFNVGMTAVDLGLAAATKKLGFDVRVWRVEALVARAMKSQPDLDKRTEVGLGPTHVIDENWPNGLSGPILFWGDFHHMARYVNEVGRIIGSKQGLRLARRYLLLDGVSEDIQRASASFGTTLLFNSPMDFTERDYGRALTAFLSNNAGTWFRDAVSTTLARGFSRNGHVGTGVDPALLIDPLQIPSNQRGSRKLGVFLGRSQATHEGLWRIARRLSDSLGARPEWLDWGDSKGFRELASIPDWIYVSGSHGSTSALDSLSELASCSAVVTDSYHAALVSWRLGIPAVTASSPTARWGWRDKRELAASQYGALDLVVQSRELADSEALDARHDHILETIRAGHATTFVRGQIEREVEASLFALKSRLLNHPLWH